MRLVLHPRALLRVVQTFQDSRASRRGWSDVVFATRAEGESDGAWTAKATSILDELVVEGRPDSARMLEPLPFVARGRS